MTNEQKQNEGGKTTNGNLPSSVGTSSNIKNGGVTTAKNAAVASQTKVPLIKPVNVPVGNKENHTIRKKALETKPSKFLTVEELYLVVINDFLRLILKTF